VIEVSSSHGCQNFTGTIMARAKVIHSQDAVMIKFKGLKKNPEPSTAVIKFPGGHVEVTRCTDGTYWASVEADESKLIIDGRIDTDSVTKPVHDLQGIDEINRIAIRIKA
jgi:hypothetical protein